MILLLTVSVNDAFGLNDSGQPTLRNSFSIETVPQLSVDVVPFDASRGGFTTGSKRCYKIWNK